MTTAMPVMGSKHCQGFTQRNVHSTLLFCRAHHRCRFLFLPAELPHHQSCVVFTLTKRFLSFIKTFQTFFFSSFIPVRTAACVPGYFWTAARIFSQCHQFVFDDDRTVAGSRRSLNGALNSSSPSQFSIPLLHHFVASYYRFGSTVFGAVSRRRRCHSMRLVAFHHNEICLFALGCSSVWFSGAPSSKRIRVICVTEYDI